MNTEKVFTAFNKDGEEILLYRKDNDTFIDLNSDNNDVYPKEQIDLETLVYANKSLNLRKHMLMASIKRKYKKDRNKLIETKNILFGQERTIKNLKTEKIDSGWRLYNRPLYNYLHTWEEINSKYLNLFEYKKQLKIEDYIFDIYTNLFDKREYIFLKDVKNISKLPSFGNGMKYILSSGVSLEDVIKESILEKKKVYECANDTRKTKITD